MKTYAGSDFPAVNGLNISLQEGVIHGILGPNGAGKTTTISILVGLIKQDSGEVIVNGFSIPSQLNQIKKSIGLVPQDIALYPSLTAFENLDYFASLYNISKSKRRSLIHNYLEKVGLYERRNDYIQNFSGGMKRRINLLAGVLHKPKILILDEPTVGTDVQSKNVILNLLKDLNADGATILYTSHLMEEAEKICNNVLIVDKGQSIATGSPRDLLSQYPNCSNLEEVYVELTGSNLRD